MCCYDKILIYVAAYVIPGNVCVCLCVCVCVCVCVWCGVNICGHIYQDFIISAHYYIVFCHLVIHDFS